jgi:hypothetical protein
MVILLLYTLLGRGSIEFLPINKLSREKSESKKIIYQSKSSYILDDIDEDAFLNIEFLLFHLYPLFVIKFLFSSIHVYVLHTSHISLLHL